VLQKAGLSREADPENGLGGSSETMYYIGLDVHKKPGDWTWCSIVEDAFYGNEWRERRWRSQFGLRGEGRVSLREILEDSSAVGCL
jgi:hypothetical protein